MATAEGDAPPTREALARRLRELRHGRGLTQQALAARAGLDRSFYVEVETAKHSLSVDRLFDIAAALEVPASDLLRGLES